MRSPAYGGAGICETFRTTFLAKSGERIPVAISGTLLYDGAGQKTARSASRRTCARS